VEEKLMGFIRKERELRIIFKAQFQLPISGMKHPPIAGVLKML